MAKAILTLNAGSSSLKIGIFRTSGFGQLDLVLRGEIEERVTAPRFLACDPTGVLIADKRWPQAAGDFQMLLDRILDWSEGQMGKDGLHAVGHRIVHGGSDHIQPERVTPELLDALERLIPLAPLHQTQNLAPIRAIAMSRPSLTQVACFDTAFHHSMPAVATRFALPRSYEAEGVRRYGFHGLSYEHIAARLRDLAPRLAIGRVITAHLGNGASLCAMKACRSIDTTMGFSALDGLVMGTRPGNLDPGVVLYLQQQHGMTVDQVEDLLYRRSGLLGVSDGIASDMRTLLASDESAARDAIQLFTYRAAREAGALASSLGGLDGIVFTGGVGEHAAPIRAAICRRLAWLGIELDERANARTDAVITLPTSRVEVRVIPADEEQMIAQHTLTAIYQE